MEWLKKIHGFLIDKGKVKAELFWIKKAWYILLLILSSIYVYNNFEQLTEQCFICLFNGNSLIFILWIILLIIPLFDSIEGYGLKINKEQEKQEEQTVKIKVLRDKILKENSVPNVEELEGRLETIIKDGNDE